VALVSLCLDGFHMLQPLNGRLDWIDLRDTTDCRNDGYWVVSQHGYRTFRQIPNPISAIVLHPVALTGKTGVAYAA